jgi:hypothetical protein
MPQTRAVRVNLSEAQLLRQHSPDLDVAQTGATSRRQLVFLSRDGIKLIVEVSDDQPWVRPMLEEFADLLSLPANWDSYGAREIDLSCVKFAFEKLLPLAMRPKTPLPSVVPTTRGGVQLEWHTRGIDLEVEVIAPGRLYAAYEDQRTGQFWEEEIRSDLSKLDQSFDELSGRG